MNRFPLAPVLGALLYLAHASPAHGQAAGEARIGLLEVVQATLQQNTQILFAREQVQHSRALAQSAGAEFDTRMRLLASRDHDPSPMAEPNTGIAAGSLRTSQLSYSMGASRVFRSGIAVTPEVGVVRTEASSHPAFAPNVATARLHLAVPLMRGRGGSGLPAAVERAAHLNASAAALDEEQVTARSVLEASLAYWHYFATYQELEVYRQAEARARALAEETRTLVASEERPAADLDPLLANLALRESYRIEAEQRLIETRHRLGLAMGMEAERMQSIPAPLGEMVLVQASEVAGDSMVERLVALALRERSDLGALGEQRSASAELLRAAEREIRPRLDLSVGVGYQGAQLGTRVGDLVSPLYTNVAGLYTSLGLQYEWAARNQGARGRVVQNRALLQQREIAIQDRERTVRSNVETVVRVLRLSIAELDRAREALRRYGAVVRSEQAKFRLGFSTLFDVIQAEEGLTRAMVNEVAARERHASAVLFLRSETGTLVDASGETARTTLEQLTRIPTP
jgi:outer membrane protein TolC